VSSETVKTEIHKTVQIEGAEQRNIIREKKYRARKTIERFGVGLGREATRVDKEKYVQRREKLATILAKIFI
jgi:hypothetical protein